MYNNDIAIENFIAYCDDMMIAEESVLTSLKQKVIAIFTRLISGLENAVRKLPNCGIKTKILKLLDRAKRRLNRTKTMNENNPGFDKEMENAMNEANDIQKEFENEMEKSYTKNQGILKLPYNSYKNSKRICKDIIFGEDELEEFKEILKILFNTENYSEYKKAYNKFITRCGLPERSILVLPRSEVQFYIEIIDDNKYKIFVTAELDDDKMYIDSSVTLYHTTRIPNLKELRPTFRASDHILYPTPRVYFYMHNPGSRISAGEHKVRDGEYVYQVKPTPNMVYVDQELHGYAIYVETNKPLNVIDVTDNFRE